MSTYDDRVGWFRIDGLLSAERSQSILDACEHALETLDDDLRVGDKPASGTRRLADVVERIPEVRDLVDELEPIIATIIERPFHLSEQTYRCPQPGFGAQKLHADDVPRLEPGPNRVATVIVPLVEFTETNGSTRVVPGSNNRVDLQRQAGNLDRQPDEQQLTGPAGAAFVFNGHLLHSGTENRSDAPRPALQLGFRIGPKRPTAAGP